MARHALSFAPVIMCLTLVGCAAQNAEIALRSKSELVGMRERDILMCAGHPTSEDNVSGGKIWMYEHGEATTGGLTFQPVLPVVGAQITEPNTGYCRVQMRFAGGRVAEVSYAGATNVWGRKDAICAPIVRNCLDYRAQL